MNNRKILTNSQAYFKTTRARLIAAFLFLFFLPSQLGKHFFLDFSYLFGVRIDYLSLVLYLTDILFLVLVFLNWRLILQQLKNNFKLNLFLSVLFLINIFASRYPLLSFYHWLKILEWYFVFIIFTNLKNNRLVLVSFLVSGLFQLFLVLEQWYHQSSLQGIFYFFGERYLSLSQPGVAKASINGVEFLRPYGTFSHPNSLAGFYLLLYFFVLTNKNFNRFIFLKNLSLLIFSLLVFASFSKTAIITYLILNTGYQLARFKLCRLCTLAKIGSMLIIGVVFLQAKSDRLSLAKRINLFIDGVLILKNHLFLGTGLGHYLIYQGNFPIKYPYFFLQPVHNIFVLFLAEAGIILAGAVGYCLFKFFKQKSKNRALAMPFLAVFITGMVDHYWWTLPQNWLLLGVVFGCLFGGDAGN